MLGLIFGIVGGVAFIAFNIYEKIKHTKKLAALKQQHTFVTTVYSSKNAMVFNAVMAGLAIGLGAINFTDLASIGISFALVCAFVGNVLASHTHRQVTFFDKGFAHDTNYVRYKSIQSITPQKNGKKFKVLFLNQTSVVLDKASWVVLEEQRKKK